jgi:hypothetical protein
MKFYSKLKIIEPNLILKHGGTRSYMNRTCLVPLLGNVYLNETNILFFAWIQSSKINKNDSIESIKPFADIYFE